MTFNYYAFTFMKNENPLLISDYVTEMNSIQKKYPKAQIVYHFELNKKNRLHIHGLIKTPTRIYINKLHPGKGWSVDFSLVRNKAAWKAYMLKDTAYELDLIQNELQLEDDFHHPLSDDEEIQLVDYSNVPTLYDVSPDSNAQ